MVGICVYSFNLISTHVPTEIVSQRYILDLNKIKYMVLKLFLKGYILDSNKVWLYICVCIGFK